MRMLRCTLIEGHFAPNSFAHNSIMSCVVVFFIFFLLSTTSLPRESNSHAEPTRSQREPIFSCCSPASMRWPRTVSRRSFQPGMCRTSSLAPKVVECHFSQKCPLVLTCPFLSVIVRFTPRGYKPKSVSRVEGGLTMTELSHFDQSSRAMKERYVPG